jgi:hypothetical protein
MFVAAALVAGLAAGSALTGVAAPATGARSNAAQATGTQPGLGMRIGAALRDAGGRLADVVADLTGSDVDDVIAERQKGTSYADIAEEAGVSSAKVVDEALKVREDLLSARVEDGTITQDQADAALDRMKTRLTERVEATDDSCTGTGGGGRGMGRGMGGRGAGCGGACTQVPATQ